MNEKTVTRGRTASLALADGVNMVKFGRRYGYFTVMNMSGNTAYFSKYSDIAAEADGVYTVPDGACITAKTDSDRIYLLGSGSVQITARDEGECSFNMPVKGGEEKAAGRNILINPDFSHPVMQRPASALSGVSSYSIDRWFRNANIVLTPEEGSIVLDCSAASNKAFFQRIENSEAYEGMDLTFSVMTDSGLLHCTGTIPEDIKRNTAYLAFARADGESAVPASDQPHIRIQTNGGHILAVIHNIDRVYHAKLETGQAPTAFAAPDYGEELMKCQRFYQIRSENNINVLDLRPSMREGAAVTVSAVTGGFAYSAEL